jgi:hypothetical protein
MIRRSLPQRRAAETFNMRFWNQAFTVTVGFYADGTPGEVFIDGGKTGQDIQNTARDAAVVLSLAIQHGTPRDHPTRHHPRRLRRSCVDFGRDRRRIANNELISSERRRLMGVDRDEFSDRDPIASDAALGAKDAPIDDPFDSR